MSPFIDFLDKKALLAAKKHQTQELTELVCLFCLLSFVANLEEGIKGSPESQFEHFGADKNAVFSLSATFSKLKIC